MRYLLPITVAFLLNSVRCLEEEFHPEATDQDENSSIEGGRWGRENTERLKIINSEWKRHANAKNTGTHSSLAMMERKELIPGYRVLSTDQEEEVQQYKKDQSFKKANARKKRDVVSYVQRLQEEKSFDLVEEDGALDNPVDMSARFRLPPSSYSLPSYRSGSYPLSSPSYPSAFDGYYYLAKENYKSYRHRKSRKSGKSYGSYPYPSPSYRSGSHPIPSPSDPSRSGDYSYFMRDRTKSNSGKHYKSFRHRNSRKSGKSYDSYPYPSPSYRPGSYPFPSLSYPSSSGGYYHFARDRKSRKSRKSGKHYKSHRHHKSGKFGKLGKSNGGPRRYYQSPRYYNRAQPSTYYTPPFPDPKQKSQDAKKEKKSYFSQDTNSDQFDSNNVNKESRGTSPSPAQQGIAETENPQIITPLPAKEVKKVTDIGHMKASEAKSEGTAIHTSSPSNSPPVSTLPSEGTKKTLDSNGDISMSNSEGTLNSTSLSTAPSHSSAAESANEGRNGAEMNTFDNDGTGLPSSTVPIQSKEIKGEVKMESEPDYAEKKIPSMAPQLSYGTDDNQNYGNSTKSYSTFPIMAPPPSFVEVEDLENERMKDNLVPENSDSAVPSVAPSSSPVTYNSKTKGPTSFVHPSGIPPKRKRNPSVKQLSNSSKKGNILKRGEKVPPPIAPVHKKEESSSASKSRVSDQGGRIIWTGLLILIFT